MKKFLIMLVGILSFIGVSTVKADTFTINSYYPVANSNTSLDIISENETIIKKLYEDLYEIYSEEQMEDYPYYIVTLVKAGNYLQMYFGVYAVPVYIDYYNNTSHLFYDDVVQSSNPILNMPTYIYYYTYDYSNSSYIAPIKKQSGIGGHAVAQELIGSTQFVHSYLFYSNFDVKFSTSNGNNLVINNYLNSGNSFTINGGDTIPTLQDALNLNIISDPNLLSNNYTEINLNNYPYVALSLKDYTEREEFYTNVEVQGQYCLTSVYNYGLTEKKDIINGYKSQRCSPYYDNYTPVRTYILESDIENHAIYYLKAYDTTKDNKVKVDTSIFNIHYITSEDEDNPILNINGRSYTSIPYGELSDSATISEEEGYVSGVVCAVGDFNCTHDVLGGHSITDIFNEPLEFFKNLIESFVSVFTLVASLIAVLPLPMQWFLYLSFTLAIALGIIKIIL